MEIIKNEQVSKLLIGYVNQKMYRIKVELVRLQWLKTSVCVHVDQQLTHRLVHLTAKWIAVQ